MTENPAPQNPAPTTSRRTWRDRLPRGMTGGRKAMAAGVLVAGLAIGGAGFGTGYAVGDDPATDTTSQTPGTDEADRGMPGDRGPMGEMGGDLSGQPGFPPADATQGQDGTEQAPDFDGDGEPDTGDGTDSGTDSSTPPSSGTLNS